jgi:hypothetical protein
MLHTINFVFLSSWGISVMSLSIKRCHDKHFYLFIKLGIPCWCKCC